MIIFVGFPAVRHPLLSRLVSPAAVPGPMLTTLLPNSQVSRRSQSAT
jgi:hypothetical protein